MNEIFEYVRVKRGPRKGQPCGVVLATVIQPKDTDKSPEIIVGWSQSNHSKGDTFKKNVGIAIARTRAINGNPTGVNVPYEVVKITKRLIPRAQKYFKGATLYSILID